MTASRYRKIYAVLLIALCAPIGCETPDQDVPLVLTCESGFPEAEFQNLDFIPAMFSMAHGASQSPPLKWTDGPTATVQWAIVFEDRDADEYETVRWMIYNLPALLRELPPAIPPRAGLGPDYWGARQGQVAFNEKSAGYHGPNPVFGTGVHRYRFTLYALDSVLDIPVGATFATFSAAIKGHVLTSATLDGKYGEPLVDEIPRFQAAADPWIEADQEWPDQHRSDARGPGPPEPTGE